MTRFAFLALGLAALLLTPLAAFAADGATPSATIDLGWFLSTAMAYLAPLVSLVLSYGLSRLYLMLSAKFKIDIDAGQRAALQAALANAAGLLIAKGAHVADGKTISVGNPAIAEAVKYAQDAAPGALLHFGLGPDDVAQKIIAKIGAIGAAAPLAVDTPAAPAASVAPAAS